MRKSTEKQAKFQNEAQMEPSALENRSDNRITSIATLDNDTTVEVFKYLKYCGLAKTSLVSKRFCDLIRTHRHKLALLGVHTINMDELSFNYGPAEIKIFDKELSPDAYNEWVIRNGYSKQVPLEIEIAAEHSTHYIYQLFALVDYKDPKSTFNTVFDARTKLSHENWPLFQHFFRLLTDPFVHLRHMILPAQNVALNLLAGAINPDHGRLKCHTMKVRLEDNMQNFTSWIKGHLHCFKIDIVNCNRLDHLFNHDDEFVDFFMTGGKCTSEVKVKFCDPCEAIGDFIHKFMDLKSSDEDKVVGFIECHPNRNINMDAFNRNYADFVVEGNINQTRGSSNLVFEFVNSNIGKKLKITISFGFFSHDRIYAESCKFVILCIFVFGIKCRE